MIKVGRVLTDLTDVFDAAMVVVAMYCLNFLHPGWTLREPASIMQEKPFEYSTATVA